MHKTWITLAVAVLAAVPISCKSTHSIGTPTAEQASAMAPVHQFVDGFNKGDIKSAVAACTDPIGIIDDFPPYEWSGAGAMSKWMSDYDVRAKKDGITDGVVTLQQARHIDVTGDRAYVVVPADYKYKKNGKMVDESDSMLTIALERGKSGWLIRGWAWSKR